MIPTEDDRAATRAHAIADLALKIASSGIETTEESAYMIHKALWHAERLLAMAEKKDQLRIHAFQLFRPDEAKMTFNAAAERFKESGWPGQMNSEDPVKKTVEKLLTQAQKKLRDKIACESSRREWQLVPISRQDIEQRVERLLCRAFRSWGIDGIQEDFDEVKARISKQISHSLHPYLSAPGWRPPNQDLTMSGYGSFAHHALEPPNFDRFLRDGSAQLEREDLHTLHSLFKGLSRLESMLPSDDMKNLLEITQAVEQTDWIPPKIKSLARKSVEALLSDAYHKDGLRKAMKTSMLFQTLHATLHSIPILENILKAPLSEELERLPDGIQLDKATLKLRVDELTLEINHAVKSARESGVSPDHPLLWSRIESIANQLEKSDSRDATAQMTEAVKWISKQLDQSKKPHTAPSSDVLLNNLLDRINLPAKHRRFRAYDVFVFAAQENLFPEKLTAPREKIQIELLLSAPRPLEVEPSILFNRSGVS